MLPPHQFYFALTGTAVEFLARLVRDAGVLSSNQASGVLTLTRTMPSDPSFSNTTGRLVVVPDIAVMRAKTIARARGVDPAINNTVGFPGISLMEYSPAGNFVPLAVKANGTTMRRVSAWIPTAEPRSPPTRRVRFNRFFF